MRLRSRPAGSASRPPAAPAASRRRAPRRRRPPPRAQGRLQSRGRAAWPWSPCPGGRALVCGVLARDNELRPDGVGLARERRELAVVLSRLALVAEALGGLRGSGDGIEAVRLLPERCLERGERLAGHAAVEQHRAVELARRRRDAGRHGGFSVLSSASAAAPIALRASSCLPSVESTQALATCHWMSTCSAQ